MIFPMRYLTCQRLEKAQNSVGKVDSDLGTKVTMKLDDSLDAIFYEIYAIVQI
jgi:hypothetical protein